MRQAVVGVTLQIIANLFTSNMLFTLLVITGPLLAMVAGGLFGGLYFFISFILAMRIRNYGKELKNYAKV